MLYVMTLIDLLTLHDKEGIKILSGIADQFTLLAAIFFINSSIIEGLLLSLKNLFKEGNKSMAA
jgi:hypothetical protein